MKLVWFCNSVTSSWHSHATTEYRSFFEPQWCLVSAVSAVSCRAVIWSIGGLAQWNFSVLYILAECAYTEPLLLTSANLIASFINNIPDQCAIYSFLDPDPSLASNCCYGLTPIRLLGCWSLLMALESIGLCAHVMSIYSEPSEQGAA